MSGGTVTTTTVGPAKAEIGILGKLGGRKFLMMIVGVVAVGLHNYLGLDQNAVLTIGGLIATYVLGQSVSEGMSGGATSTTTPISDPAEVSRIDNATEQMRLAGTLAEKGHDPADITELVANLNK